MQDNVVWTSTLDGKYEVTVTHTDGYHGVLTISEGTEVLHRESVGLSYGAMFGPDFRTLYASRIAGLSQSAFASFWMVRPSRSR